MPNNPLLPADIQNFYQWSAQNAINPPHLPPGYVLATHHTNNGILALRLFDAAYISTGIIDPNRLGTGATGAGNLYLADDGTWKAVGGGGGGGDMYKATYDVDNDGTVDSAERIEIIVRNSTGVTLTKGQVVYLSGATGNRPNALLSQANTEATSSKTIGIVVADITNNSDGYVAVNGTLHDLDTSAFADGDAVWLSATTAGAYTNTIPAEPNHTVFIGYIARSHPTQGRLVILIQNGYELNELHGVLISSEANNDLLVYESSTSLWKNKTISTIFGGTPLVSVPTLDQVTTAGNTTTNSISVGGATVGQAGGNGVINFPNTTSGFSASILSNYASNSLEMKVASTYVKTYGSGQILLNGATTITGVTGAAALVVQQGNAAWSPVADFNGSSGTALRVNTNGNILIGTTTDAGYKLDVNGTGRFQGDVTVSTNLSVGLTNTFGRFNVRGADNSSTSRAITVQNQSQTLIFDIYNDGRTLLNPQGPGNILIGTTTDAGYKLDVNGTARVSDTATIAKALNITGTVAVTGTGTTYANTFSSTINGTFSNASIATLLVNDAVFTGSGSGISNYAIVAGNSSFYRLTVSAQSTFTDSGAAQLRLQGYNILTGASGLGSGTLLLTNRDPGGGALGLAATYGGGGSRISIFNQYNDGGTNSTSQIKVNIAGTDIAIFAGSGELAIGKGATLSGASLTTSTSITASTALARGVYFNNTLVAAANNDVLVGLDIAPTYTVGAFTGVSNLALRVAFVPGRYISFTQRPGYTDYGRIQFTNVTGAEITSSGGISLTPGDGNLTLSLGNGLTSKITTPGSTKYDSYGNQTPSTLAGNTNRPVLFTSTIPDGSIDGFIFENTSSGSRNLFKVIQNNTTLFTLNPNGNVLIGTTTDSGYKLDVNGTTRVKGTGTTNATTAFLVQNSTPANLFSVLDDGSVIFDLITATSLVTIRRASAPTSRKIEFLPSGGARFYTFDGEAAPNANGDDGAWLFKGRHRRAADSGIASAFRIEPLFFQDQYNNIQLNSIHIVPNITVTGTATNVTVRGIYYNPTISTLTGAAHRAIETTSGDVLLATTSGNVGVGITPIYKLDINGAVRFQSTGTSSVTHSFLFRNDNSAYGGFTIGSSGQSLSIQQANGYGYLTAAGFFIGSTNGNIWTNNGSILDIQNASGTTTYLRVANTTGNVLINTTTDAGYKLYVNGVIRSTSDVVAELNLKSNYQAGDEGGEITLNKPATGTVIDTSVTIDVYQNKLRIFESGGLNRGGYFDISGLSNGVGTNFSPTGYTGILNIMGNPPGQQNVHINNGIITSID